MIFASEQVGIQDATINFNESNSKITCELIHFSCYAYCGARLLSNHINLCHISNSTKAEQMIIPGSKYS
jgi:hypothetical protein